MSPLLRWARSRALSPLRSRLLWWVLLAWLIAVVVLAGVFRKPLSDWIWPDTRIQQLVQRGDAALARGQLSAADGSGARELFEAAQALDNDRSEAREGLARTGAAAVARARRALVAGQLSQAQRLLQLAQQLQVPQAQVTQIAHELRQQQAAHAGLGNLMARAAEAQRAGNLDGSPDSALPLYQRVLELAPDRTEALDGREDALTDLLQRARTGLAQDKLAEPAAMLAAARDYDSGHADLPQTEAEFNRLLEARAARAESLLRRARLQPAARDFAEILAAQPDNANARRGLERVANEYAAQAAREAADFRFDAAERSLRQAREWAPSASAIGNAEQAIARARQVHNAQAPKLSAGERERRLRELMEQVAVAETSHEWLTPPGASAYDKLRSAQAIAPRDRRVLRAVQRIVPATRSCFEDELSGNRLRAARVCLDAWQSMAPSDDALSAARRQLAQRWIAVGSERLGSGDAAFARQALREARALDPATPELAEFSERVNAAMLRQH